jgi:ABC-type amino acid transport substrate-binding protein
MNRIVLIISITFFTLTGYAQQTDTLIVGYNPSPPFLIKENGILHGPSFWLWQKIAKEHGLPYKLVEMPLDSLLQGLATGTVDLSTSPLTITSERIENMDFTPPYHIAHSAILTENISGSERALEFIGSFLSVNFFRAMGALAFVILVFGFLEWYFERKYNEEEFGNGLQGLWNGFWWSAVTMTTVGYGDKSPKTVGGRIIALIWMFTAIIIISGFTASIASSLTVNQIGSSKYDIQDYKETQLGTIEKSGTDRWLRDNFFPHKTTYSSMNQLIQALNNKEIEAIAYDRPNLQNVIKNDSLSAFRLLNVKYNPQFYGFGLNRDLPDELKQQISISVLKHTEGMDWKILLSEYDLE